MTSLNEKPMLILKKTELVCSQEKLNAITQLFKDIEEAKTQGLKSLSPEVTKAKYLKKREAL